MSATKPPSIALWGAGMISGAHGAAARFLQMPVVGVASRTPERAAEQAARLTTRALTYADLPGDAEVVVVSTPPQMHAADTLRLLDAGAAVVLEKPLCTTLTDADALVAAEADHQGRVLYAENLAYAPVVREMLALAARLGPITHLELRTLQTLPTWGDFTSDEWGGGALFDLGVHPLALAVLAAGANGAGPVTSVRATLRGGAAHNSDEHAEVELTFGNGLVGSVVSSWQSEDQIWDVQMSSQTGVVRVEFWPTPTLEHNGEPVPLPASSVPLAFIEDLGYLGQLRAFAHDLAAAEVPFMDVSFGRMILDIVCAAYWSAGHGGAPEAVPFAGPRDRTPLQLWHGSGS
jgi:myo-inositol 2-dehydrogenase/D-chiro-inositol 1-dehydrogenase